MKVLAVVEEGPRNKGEDQFEFHCIRGPDCSQEDLGTDEVLCPKCKSIYELVKKRMETTLDLRQNEFNPKANWTVLSGLALSRREQLNIATERVQTSGKSFQGVIGLLTIEHLMKQTSMKCKVNQWSDLVFNEDTVA